MLENAFGQIKEWTARVLFAVLTAVLTFVPITYLSATALLAQNTGSRCANLPIMGAIGFGAFAGIFMGTLSLIFGPPWTWHEPFLPDSKDKLKFRNLQDEH